MSPHTSPISESDRQFLLDVNHPNASQRTTIPPSNNLTLVEIHIFPSFALS